MPVLVPLHNPDSYSNPPRRTGCYGRVASSRLRRCDPHLTSPSHSPSHSPSLSQRSLPARDLCKVTSQLDDLVHPHFHPTPAPNPNRKVTSRIDDIGGWDALLSALGFEQVGLT